MNFLRRLLSWFGRGGAVSGTGARQKAAQVSGDGGGRAAVQGLGGAAGAISGAQEGRVESQQQGAERKGLLQVPQAESVAAEQPTAVPTREEQHAAQVKSLLETLRIKPAQDGAGAVTGETGAGVVKGVPPAPRSRLQLKARQEAAAPRVEPELAETRLREETRRAIANLTQAPAMGWLASNLLQIMRRTDVDLDEVVEAVEKDPAIATRILRMANSPAIASFERVTDLKTAVSLLGIQRVRLTAQALVTLQETGRLVEGFNWRHLWIHSFACALLAAEIPRRLRLEVPANCYLAGLLHDLGKILLSYLNPPKYRQLLMEAVCEGTELHVLELRHFGMTHEEAGAEFARLNKLPDEVVAAISGHANPGQLATGETATTTTTAATTAAAAGGPAEPRPAEARAAEQARLLAACISVANYLAKTHGLGFSGSSLASMEANLGETEGWKLLAAALPRPPTAEDFHLSMRPFIAELKLELHEWASGRR